METARQKATAGLPQTAPSTPVQAGQHQHAPVHGTALPTLHTNHCGMEMLVDALPATMVTLHYLHQITRAVNSDFQ